MEELKLEDKWVLWYHRVDDEDWSLKSYQKLTTLSTIEDFYKMANSIKNISAGMFFIMKEGITPLWEDERNVKGGYWSYKVNKSLCNKVWFELTASLIGKTLTADINHYKYINGISFSPKINNCIFKIWNNDKRISDNYIISNSIQNLNIKDAYYKSY